MYKQTEPVDLLKLTSQPQVLLPGQSELLNSLEVGKISMTTIFFINRLVLLQHLYLVAGKLKDYKAKFIAEQTVCEGVKVVVFHHGSGVRRPGFTREDQRFHFYFEVDGVKGKVNVLSYQNLDHQIDCTFSGIAVSMMMNQKTILTYKLLSISIYPNRYDLIDLDNATIRNCYTKTAAERKDHFVEKQHQLKCTRGLINAILTCLTMKESRAQLLFG